MDFKTALTRYLTQQQLDAIEKVQIGIAGAGGLGSNCAAALVRCGFKKLRIIDYDCIEPSNLNRQFFFADQIGMAKVEALGQNLCRINPDLELELIQQKITAQNVGDWFEDRQVVLECLDVPAIKSLLVQHYASAGKLVVAVSGIAGWGNSDDIVVRKVGSKLFVIGDEKSGIDNMPPLAPRVAIAAAKQADIVLAYILGNMPQEGR
ncbi:MAG: sulfur carrier protein ThiS adenylyltransferase ThiF [Veillonellaceae bacterium]|jgi:sulfur carrier protein ThiS adenylyltransferase|nr:sulfur carrier protein ThiS adenylyltransferase ThiF [Veillonellaceae bacterium]